MHRPFRTAFSLSGLVFVLARCGAAPTEPVVSMPVDSRAVTLAAVDCDAAGDIGALIDLLENERVLNHGRATALRKHLAQAVRFEAAGRSRQAADRYAHLVEQVETWVKGGALEADEVADLLACVEDFLDGPDDPEPDPDPEPEPDPEPDPVPVPDGRKSPGEWDAATAVAVFDGGTFYYLND